MSVFCEKSSILITCPKGNTPYLASELTSLGFPVLSSEPAAVLTEGTLEDTMRMNLYVRTGHRVLFLLQAFKAETPDDMYEGVSDVNWERYLPDRGYLSVRSFVDIPSVRDTRYANVKCKDAIVDRMRKTCGRRPDSGPARTGAVIFLHWRNETCSIYLDTSGESLSHRGYRKIPLKAPLRETTAAAIVLATGWNGKGSFLNPMCGSGTLAIEAALVALGRAPGLLRSNYGFMHLRGFPKPLWEETRKAVKGTPKRSIEGMILATDIHGAAVDAAKKNATTAGVDHLIDFRTCGYEETPVPLGGGVVVLNPEYGERLGKADELESMYVHIGDFFKQKCAGYTGYVFSGNLDMAKRVGLKPRRKHIFFNANIECRLFEYELYKGSRKPGNPAPPTTPP